MVIQKAADGGNDSPITHTEHLKNDDQNGPPPPLTQPPDTNVASEHPDAGRRDLVTPRTPSPSLEKLAALQSDPEYQQAAKWSDTLSQLAYGENGLGAIDHNFGNGLGLGKDDGKVDRGNVHDAANNPDNPALQQVAKLLDSDPALFTYLDKDGDTLITMDDVKRVLAESKAKVSSMEAAAIGASTGGSGASSNSSAATGTQPTTTPATTTPATTTPAGTGATDGSATTPGTNPGEVALPPFTSNREGTDRTADALSYAGMSLNQIDTAIATAAAKTPPDQAAMTVLQNQRSKYAFAQQTLMSLQQQQFEAMSNMSKIFSEMAKAAIGNMR